MIANLTLEQVFDSPAIRVDGPRAAGELSARCDRSSLTALLALLDAPTRTSPS